MPAGITPTQQAVLDALAGGGLHGVQLHAAMAGQGYGPDSVIKAVHGLLDAERVAFDPDMRLAIAPPGQEYAGGG